MLGIKRKSTESALAILTSTPLKDLLLGLSVLRSILKKYADHTKTMRRKYLEIGHDCIFAYSNIVRVITAEPLNTHGYSNHVCLQGELWLHGWLNLGNVQVWLVLAARQCVNIQIETQRILKFKLPSKMPIYAEKYAICALC